MYSKKIFILKYLQRHLTTVKPIAGPIFACPYDVDVFQKALLKITCLHFNQTYTMFWSDVTSIESLFVQYLVVFPITYDKRHLCSNMNWQLILMQIIFPIVNSQLRHPKRFMYFWNHLGHDASINSVWALEPSCDKSWNLFLLKNS